MVHQMRAPRFLSLLIGFLLLSAACSSGGGSDPGGGTDVTTAGGGIRLEILAGQVQTDTGSGFADAEDGQLLAVGDAVKTGADGRAELVFAEGVVRIDYATSLEVSADTPLSGELSSGQAYVRVAELTETGSRVSVATPTATASVRGTIFNIRLSKDATSLVYALEDTTDVDGLDSGSLELLAGTKVTASPEGALGKPKPLTEADLNEEWTAFNRGLDGQGGDETSPSPENVRSSREQAKLDDCIALSRIVDEIVGKIGTPNPNTLPAQLSALSRALEEAIQACRGFSSKDWEGAGYKRGGWPLGG